MLRGKQQFQGLNEAVAGQVSMSATMWAEAVIACPTGLGFRNTLGGTGINHGILK